MYKLYILLIALWLISCKENHKKLEEDINNYEVEVDAYQPTDEELEFLKPNKVLISALQMSAQSKEHLKTLMRKKVTAIAWDYISDKHHQYPIVRSMAEIAGTTSILLASELQ